MAMAVNPAKVIGRALADTEKRAAGRAARPSVRQRFNETFAPPFTQEGKTHTAAVKEYHEARANIEPRERTYDQYGGTLKQWWNASTSVDEYADFHRFARRSAAIGLGMAVLHPDKSKKRGDGEKLARGIATGVVGSMIAGGVDWGHFRNEFDLYRVQTQRGMANDLRDNEGGFPGWFKDRVADVLDNDAKVVIRKAADRNGTPYENMSHKERRNADIDFDLRDRGPVAKTVLGTTRKATSAAQSAAAEVIAQTTVRVVDPVKKWFHVSENNILPDGVDNAITNASEAFTRTAAFVRRFLRR